MHQIQNWFCYSVGGWGVGVCRRIEPIGGD